MAIVGSGFDVEYAPSCPKIKVMRGKYDIPEMISQNQLQDSALFLLKHGNRDEAIEALSLYFNNVMEGSERHVTTLLNSRHKSDYERLAAKLRLAAIVDCIRNSKNVVYHPPES